MPEQALYLKWRPTTFDEVVGQEHITRTLRNSLKSGRIRHAYLFSGPRGTGKTSMARLLAKAVNCLNADPDRRPCNECSACIAVNEGRYLDLIEIDAATHTGVDDVRDLRDKIAFAPGEGRYKVYIIDEVHRFTGNAFDALLKTLEEPPDHAIFVLATTEIDKVPATIKSRCLQFEFRRLPLREVADRLQLIVENEGLSAERSAIELIARQGTGSVRDSISLLDQIIVDPDETITLELTQRVLGTASVRAVRDLVSAIVNQNTAQGLEIINTAVDSGSDPRQFGQQVVDHLRAVMLAQTAGVDLVEAAQEDRDLFEQQASLINRDQLLQAVRAFNEAINNYRGGWQPQLALELALIEATRLVEQPVAVAAPAQTQAQQASPPEPAAEAVEELPPGEPPIIPLEDVRQHWNNVLQVVYRYSSSAPAVMQNFRVQRVEGNTVTLATDKEFYLKRLQHPEKLQLIEFALKETHKKALKVRLALVENVENLGSGESATAKTRSDDPFITAAKEQLGAEIHRTDDQE